MTEYEFQDSRSTLGKRNLTVMKFWLTVTFAVYAATYYAGRELDVFSSIAILTFYVLTTFVCWSMLLLIQAQNLALAKDAAAYLEESGRESEILRAQVFAPKSYILNVFLIVMGTSIVAFCLYTLQHSLLRS